MKAVKIILYVIGGLVLLFVILAFIAPVNYHIERENTIEAPAEVVFEQAVHFSNFQLWSPWSDLDPDMEVKIEGTEGEIGTTYSWRGNREAGVGTQTLVAISGDTAFIDLHFKEPFESEAQSYYIIEEIDAERPITRITWGMYSTMSRPLNIMGWLMNLEKAVGEQYEDGLNRLKELVEGMDWKPEIDAEAEDPEAASNGMTEEDDG